MVGCQVGRPGVPGRAWPNAVAQQRFDAGTQEVSVHCLLPQHDAFFHAHLSKVEMMSQLSLSSAASHMKAETQNSLITVRCDVRSNATRLLLDSQHLIPVKDTEGLAHL